MYLYDYLFYKFYKIISIGTNKDVAEWISVILISLLEYFNISVILVCFDMFFISKGVAILFLVILMIINYFIFLHKSRYLQIIKRFSNESLLSKYFSLILVLGYIYLSIWLIFNTTIQDGVLGFSW